MHLDYKITHRGIAPHLVLPLMMCSLPVYTIRKTYVVMELVVF